MRRVLRAAALAAAVLAGAGCARPSRPPAERPTGTGAASSTLATTFTNPIVSSQDAGDPWVVRHGGYYYFTATLDPNGGLWVWRSRTLTGLDSGTKVKVWTAPASGPTSHQIWAPELHRLDSRWYLYFTASDGIDAHHRLYVLAARTDDPLGAYDAPVRVDPAFDHYAIDASVLTVPGRGRYLVFCADGLWAAPLATPTRVGGPAVRIAMGSEPWEHGWRRTARGWVQDAGYWIEAPEALVHDGRVFLVYSAGHTATPHYYLGLLTLTPGGDPMDPAAWVKRRAPLFGPYVGPDGAVYTPGHNAFTTSPDGTESWLVYHAKDGAPDSTGGNASSRRTVRIQRFTWGADGAPVFGHPIPSGVPLRNPSGEQ